MMRRSTSILLVLLVLLVMGCEDQVVAPENAEYLASKPSPSASPAMQRGSLTMGPVLNFAAPLSGSQEVPPVDTRATGLAKFKLSKDGAELSYKLNVASIEDVVASHIHCAPDGVNGPVGITLFSGGPVSPDGTLAEGTITEPDAGNGCGWETLDDAVEAMVGGDTYVNVHTLAHPGGEIRGQIDRGNGVRGGTAGFARYMVTIENLTSTQPLTPPVVATHRPATGIFRVGTTASFEVKEVAENGNLTPLTDALDADRHVADHVVAPSGSPPPLLPGEAVTVSITAERGATFISFASMLICTNDGFTGLDTEQLPEEVGDTVTYTTNSYDAGTEVNTEDFADLVPPCQVLGGASSDDTGTAMSDPALAEDGVIHPHAGIQGGDDLDPAIHGWTDPVTQVTIERVE